MPEQRGVLHLDEYPENGWDKVMDTNVKGVFFLNTKAITFTQRRC